MARKVNMALVMAMLFVATLLRSSAAQSNRAPASAPAASPGTSSSGGGRQTFTVGDGSGWIIPLSTNFYQTWAANKTFRVGDSLVFNFTNIHNVAEVNKASFTSCSSSNSTPTTVSPYRKTLTAPGEHFYICTVGTHCSLGQKLAINVTAAGTPSSVPAPAGTPPSVPTLSPPSVAAAPSSDPSSGPSATSPAAQPSTAAPLMAVAALPVTLLSLALALGY
ncbi:unnamed protein product [Cuscuta epithymum]|uniref:Phytocyanin domain-containing protein n=1 Tax=Cuscuta epithymum TaxID=186058 RepID=A0AAV0EPH3_9ASTE|nr:unnamed protein product [Cuscuta epithymum]